ncbi:MAG: lysylphosphatidylglycerol synthase transmembrane domain-containing protein [bacterium]
MKSFGKKCLELLTHRYFLRFLGLAIFLGILWKVNIGKVFGVLQKTDPVPTVLGLLLAFPLAFVRSYRWNHIMCSLDINVSSADSFFYQIVSQMAFFTPAKIGEFIKVFYLKGRDYPLSTGIVSVLGDRVFDLTAMIVTAFAASFYFFSIPMEWMIVLIVLAFISLGLVYLLIENRHTIYGWATNVLLFFVPSSLEVKFENVMNEFKEYLSELTVVWTLNLLIISGGALCLQVWRIWWFGRALSIDVAFFPLMGIVSLMSLSNLLPISFLGLGTRDAVFLYFFGMLGVKPELAIALSLVILASILINAMFGAILFSIYPPEINVKQYLSSL